MPALTPSFLFDFESRMRVIVENEYARLASNMWWSRVTKVIPSQSRREMVTWMLNTAKIEDLESQGGKMVFEDLVSRYTEFENRSAGAGLKLKRQQFEDTDGNGIQLGAEWASQIGAYMAYWPQKKIVSLLKDGATSGNNSYDGVTFFNNAHPLNPFSTSGATFANIFTGSAGATPSTDPNDAGYPGACPIDDSVTVDVALANLSKIRSYIKSIRMPNGEDPRFLRPTMIVAPPKMEARVTQLTNAKFIAQAAASGGGSGDVEALVRSFGFVQPIIADELTGFESETSFFLVCEQLTASQLGGLVYVDREPFKITYYTGQGGGTGADANLDRADELEWHCKGRNVAGYGHPFLIFKCKAS